MNREQIEQRFVQYGMKFDTEIIDQFHQFLDFFVEYNSHTNLSAIREREDIVLKHFIDSLMVNRFITLSGMVLDIGTGGWFPGIPLAIVDPELHVVLLDSVGKKIRACQHFMTSLGLQNIEAFQARAEEFHKLFEEPIFFDAIVSRSTAQMDVMIEYARPLLRLGGSLILYKTPDDKEWTNGLRRAKQLWFVLEADHHYTLDIDKDEADQHIRHIVVFQKKKD